MYILHKEGGSLLCVSQKEILAAMTQIKEQGFLFSQKLTKKSGVVEIHYIPKEV